ncbi:MAG: hypothetical protein WB773_21290, partial [Isosphaeraceae bacterium]
PLSPSECIADEVGSHRNGQAALPAAPERSVKIGRFRSSARHQLCMKFSPSETARWSPTIGRPGL